MQQDSPLIQVKDLKKHFKVGRNSILKAVDGVTFDIRKGETIGLVGESGCGKTTCGRTIMGLYSASDGEVLYDGLNVHNLRGKKKRPLQGEHKLFSKIPMHH